MNTNQKAKRSAKKAIANLASSEEFKKSPIWLKLLYIGAVGTIIYLLSSCGTRIEYSQENGIISIVTPQGIPNVRNVK